MIRGKDEIFRYWSGSTNKSNKDITKIMNMKILNLEKV